MAGDLKRISNVSRLSSSSSNSANWCTYRQRICYSSKLLARDYRWGSDSWSFHFTSWRRLTEFGRFYSLLVFCFGSRSSRQAGGCYRFVVELDLASRVHFQHQDDLAIWLRSRRF
uniref:(northern house mosquito) hypothetical protein n=1 Tax=Culex pipiens TaxID=7175 RepID=A0A8D8A2R9_CULPI